MMRVGTPVIPPSPASPRRPLRGWGAHFSRLVSALRSGRAAFLSEWLQSPVANNQAPAEPQGLSSDLSYWDDEEAVKLEREDDIRHQLGLGKQDSARLLEEWKRIYASGE